MTSEPARSGGRIGQVLTALVVLACVVVLTGLGVWQVQRLHWKHDYLRRVAAAQAAPARPLDAVLADEARGQDVEYDRVEAACLPSPASTLFVWDVQGERHGWRALGVCRLPGERMIVVDRGFAATAGGRLEAPRSVLAPLGRVLGQLRRPSGKSWVDQAGDAVHGFHSRQAAISAFAARVPGRYLPLVLVAEREAPAAAGVTPAPLPTDIPNNHLGYALTWFGLALALIGVYLAAMIKRRRRP